MDKSGAAVYFHCKGQGRFQLQGGAEAGGVHFLVKVELNGGLALIEGHGGRLAGEQPGGRRLGRGGDIDGGDGRCGGRGGADHDLHDFNDRRPWRRLASGKEEQGQQRQAGQQVAGINGEKPVVIHFNLPPAAAGGARGWGTRVKHPDSSSNNRQIRL